MSESLFDLPNQPSALPAAADGPAPITERQVEQIRALFDAAGMQDQAQRKAVVESSVGAPVPGLRALSWAQALRLIEDLPGPRQQESAAKRSDWDDREEETWIDRL